MSVIRRKFALGLGAAIACPTCLSLASAAEKGEPGGAAHWTYGGSDGPDKWGSLSPKYGVCDLGVQQSPIDLRRAIRAQLRRVDVAYKSMPLRIVNNGHTIQVNCEPGSKIVLDGEDFKLLQFHFHHPSEHLVDGTSYPLEVHFVHLGASGNLAVLGAFMKPGGENTALASIWRDMPQTAGPEKATATRISPSALLPADRRFYRYLGSLTTPPCSETVIWTVLKSPISVSDGQIAVFATLFPMNARPAQTLHRRFLLQSL